MEDEVFEKVFGEISHIFDTWFNIDYDEQRKELRKILEEIYQMGKDNKFKDIGYIDVDEYYPEDKKEAKP